MSRRRLGPALAALLAAVALLAAACGTGEDGADGGEGGGGAAGSGGGVTTAAAGDAGGVSGVGFTRFDGSQGTLRGLPRQAPGRELLRLLVRTVRAGDARDRAGPPGAGRPGRRSSASTCGTGRPRAASWPSRPASPTTWSATPAATSSPPSAARCCPPPPSSPPTGDIALLQNHTYDAGELRTVIHEELLG